MALAVIGSKDDLIQEIQLAKAEAVERGGLGRVLFFLGAGCSRSAGIPVGSEIAKSLTIKLAQTYELGHVDDPVAALDLLIAAGRFPSELKSNDINWYEVYDECFGSHYKTPDRTKGVFSEYIDAVGSKVNWSHLCLGELVRAGICGTVVTTNFDLLALRGLAAAGVVPIVSDGLESLSRIDGSSRYPQLIQLNGSVHSYRLRNRPEDLIKVGEDAVASACIRELFRSNSVLIFIGYAGRERPIMRLLQKAAKEFPDKSVFWCMYEDTASALSSDVEEFLEHSENARVILGQDADSFFFDLCKSLRVGPPFFLRDPLAAMSERLEWIVPPSIKTEFGADIVNELHRVRELLARAKAGEGASQRRRAPARSALDAARAARLRGDDRAAFKIAEEALKNAPTNGDLIEAALRSGVEFTKHGGSISDLEAVAEIARKNHSRTKKKSDQKSRLDAAIYLGLALQNLGEVGEDKYLFESAKVYEDALSEIEGTQFHSDKYVIMNNLAGVYHYLFAKVSWEDNEQCNIYVDKAIEIMKEVVAVSDPERDAYDWGLSVMNMANTYCMHWQHTDNQHSIDKAIELYGQVVSNKEFEKHTLEWASSKVNRARAYLDKARSDSDVSESERIVRLGISDLEDVERVLAKSDAPAVWADLHHVYGLLLGEIAALTGSEDHRKLAEQRLNQARSEFRHLGMKYDADKVGRNLAKLAKADSPAFTEAAK